MIMLQSRHDERFFDAGDFKKDGARVCKLIAVNQSGHDRADKRNAGAPKLMRKYGKVGLVESAEQYDYQLILRGSNV